ncbi:hypothetical protein PCH_Pc20g05100 [Penicillium rubens Wisconsin 54-1255]|uniref:Uncharacterized protein n=1 Tax=Penicillium rubens (strain ATCC 28089 / DSM 1075 / NRRL 1951 / Wisconsin 54-1255) TaxID=500485 RepID=B6HEF0_PENRW|nr:hypothetical protein PCH_Pc20g05100 [Penicillium rubens Wisconsin 54-1255]
MDKSLALTIGEYCSIHGSYASRATLMLISGLLEGCVTAVTNRQNARYSHSVATRMEKYRVCMHGCHMVKDSGRNRNLAVSALGAAQVSRLSSSKVLDMCLIARSERSEGQASSSVTVTPVLNTTSAVTQGMKRPSWLTDPTASTFDSTGQLRIFWTLFPKPFCHWFPVVVPNVGGRGARDRQDPFPGLPGPAWKVPLTHPGA